MKKIFILVVLITIYLTPNLSGTAKNGVFKIITTPSIALYGEPFEWKISGLKSGEKVTVTAASRDARKILWESSAVFRADSEGQVDLSRHAPVTGSYQNADIFGLLWSMKASGKSAKKPSLYRVNSTAGWIINLRAVNSSGAETTTRFRCMYQKPGTHLVRIPLDQDGLSGVLYTPAEGGPFPGIIILGGSEGGLFEPRARALAANGFAALTLAYFRYPGLPDELVDIPLEYFDLAIEWMGVQPGVRKERIGLMGGSKGGELALLVGSRNQRVRAVAALTPAAHSWEGQTMKFFSPDYTPVASWSLGGKPLPFIPYKVTEEMKKTYLKGELSSFVPFYRDGLLEADPAAVSKAVIPVERINGPVLLISGTDDQAWPAEEFCRSIKIRMKQTGFPYQVKHVNIKKGGHLSCLPFLITANHGVLIDGDPCGGSPRTDVHGGYRSWKEILDFFKQYLSF